MTRTIVPILVLGLSTNLEPGTLVVFIMLLDTERARRNALAFLGGWFVSLAVVFAASYSLLHGKSPVSGSTEELLIQLAEIAVALVLAWVALHEWRRRNAGPPTAPTASRWSRDIGPRTAFVAAMWEQPWTVTMAAAVVVVRAHLAAADALVAFLVFAAASTSLVATVWMVFRRDPKRAETVLRAAEAWVRNRGPRVFSAVAALAALAFLADGLHGLLSR